MEEEPAGMTLMLGDVVGVCGFLQQDGLVVGGAAEVSRQRVSLVAEELPSLAKLGWRGTTQEEEGVRVEKMGVGEGGRGGGDREGGGGEEEQLELLQEWGGKGERAGAEKGGVEEEEEEG